MTNWFSASPIKILMVFALLGTGPVHASDPFGALERIGGSIFGGSSDDKESETSNSTKGSEQSSDGGLGERLSTLGGSIIGGWVGSEVGDSYTRSILTMGGAWVGGFVASETYKALAPDDQTAVQETSVEALETAQDGETVVWRNPDSGVKAEVTPVSTQIETQQTKIARNAEIQSPPPFTVIGAMRIATANVNMRAGPSKTAQLVGRLSEGEIFRAMGRVNGTGWIIVAENGKATGYVSAAFVKAYSYNEDTDEERKSAVVEKLQEESKYASDPQLVADSEGVVLDDVAVTTECRPTEMKITDDNNGNTETSTFKACKGSDGAWEIS